jgi:RNA polymerase sigma factor (sigma-70 family)
MSKIKKFLAEKEALKKLKALEKPKALGKPKMLEKPKALQKPKADRGKPLYTKLPASDGHLLGDYFSKDFTKSYHMALRLTRNEHMAEDIAQESFYKACAHFQKINNHQHFTRWLAITTYTTAVDAIRKRRRYVLLGDYRPTAANLPADTYLPEPTLLQQEEKKLMQDQVDSLDPIYGDIIRLKFFYDMSYHEIAKLRGIKENTLRSQCHRALKLLNSMDSGREMSF